MSESITLSNNVHFLLMLLYPLNKQNFNSEMREEIMMMNEKFFYPLVEEELKKSGKITSLNRFGKQGEFIPDFTLETEDKKITAVKIGRVIGWKRQSKLLYCDAFQILVYLQKYGRVLYIAHYEQLKPLCDILHLVGVEPGEKFKTMELGYIVGTSAFDDEVNVISVELGRVKKILRKLGYRV